MWPLLWPFKRVRTATNPSTASNAAGPCYIAALPTELLTVILLLAGEANRPAIRLVCKAWNQALVAGGLWHTFCLESPAPLLSKGQAGSAAATAAAAWLAGKLALLQQTAPHVQALVVRNSSGTIQALAGGTQLERCLAVPQLAGLRSLTLGIRPRLSQRLLSSILRFQQLIELHILSGGRLPANTFAVVAGFPFLRSLHVSSSQLEEPLLAVILQRTALTALSLGASRRPLLAWAVQHLPALPGLRAVSIAESSSELHEQAVVQQWLKAFPRLATFEYACSRREGGLKLPGCNRLQACKFAPSNPAAPYASAAAVELGAVRLTSLPDLLASLLPAGTPLHSLTLRRGSTSAAALGQRCTALSALTMLALDGVMSATSLEAGMAALVSQTPLLADLHLSMRRYARNGRLATLPSAVVQRQGLRRLSLEGPAICPGPYLSGIQELSLLLREEEGLPACLAEARSLEQLSLSWRRPHGQLDVAQVASTLAPSHCPRLVTLRLSNCYKPSQQERAVLKERVPQLLEIVGGVERPPAPTLQDWLRAGLSKLAWAWQNAY